MFVIRGECSIFLPLKKLYQFKFKETQTYLTPHVVSNFKFSVVNDKIYCKHITAVSTCGFDNTTLIGAAFITHYHRQCLFHFL
jgi:hypothetical protein